ALNSHPDVVLLPRTTAIGAYDEGVVAALERVSDHLAEPAPFAPRQRLHVIRAGRVVLATGTVERLIALPGNDRPGVMLATAARAYVNRMGVAPGRHAVFFVNNDEAYAAARDLAAAGVSIAAIVDPRGPTAISTETAAQGMTVLHGQEVCKIEGRAGVKTAWVRAVGKLVTRRIHCDLVCLSGGYTPQTQLATQAGLKLGWRDDIAGFAAPDTGAVWIAAGAAAGVFGRLEAARHGAATGARNATKQFEHLPLIQPKRDALILPLWEVRAEGKAFVDLQHDVTTDDMRLSHREGYSAIEHAKRYTTHGMGTDQGKTGGLVGAAVLAEARGLPVSAVGVSKPRPFVTPVSFGALAGMEVGAHFKPERKLPLHDWHDAHGAVFVRIGLWLRPLVYSGGDTSWGPVLAEARAVRTSVGITDVSSLGKIDVQGKDAGVFLDHIYANTFSTLAIGKARYGLMLREDGLMFDDGTTSRLAEDHFIVTTTTGNAVPALEHMEFHAQTVWRDMDVQITSIADQWAQFAVAGPNARAVLSRVVNGIDLSNAGFPFMAAGEAEIAGVAGRIFRISFSGELAYEVAVPAGYAEHVWQTILAAGEPFGIRQYGLDALNLMRIEKGHVAGSELNGQTTAADLGLGKMLKKHGDFIGKVMGQRPGLTDPARLQLVGLHPSDNSKRLRNGAHLVSATEPRRSQGFLTAVCMASEGPHDWLGLALLEGGHARIGETLISTSPIHGESVEVHIVSPHRLDPENARVKA
ncbi:MAG: sarcosine oxidase subunit alpha, partial [Bosea sp. (in: a-proteobacteria)]